MRIAEAESSRGRSLVTLARMRRYWIFVMVVVLLVGAGQLVEDARDTPTLEMFTQTADTLRTVTVPRWAVIGLTLYMLLMLRLIRRTATNTLRDIRSVVLCDDGTFEKIRLQMTRIHWTTGLAIGVLVLGFVVVLLFPAPMLHTPIPIVDHPKMPNGETYLPVEPLAALVVVLGYWLIGWTALTLLLTAVRLGGALGDLASIPLAINVYDTDNLVPLGRMALVLSLAPAGIFVILLVGLGVPTTLLAWFTFVLASFASILALVLPLRGVHRQMETAKTAASRDLNLELSKIQNELVANAPDAERTSYLGTRAGALVSLRKVVQESPTWPFRDTLAVTRAALIASSPLIYTALNELIRIFLIEPLAK